MSAPAAQSDRRATYFSKKFWEAVGTLHLEEQGQDIMRRFAVLQHLTDWNDFELGEQLRCAPDLVSSGSRPEAERRLTFSAAYLGWTRGLCSEVGDSPVPELHRNVIRCARILLRDAGDGSARERLASCEAAFAPRDELPSPAVGYLRLGEVQRAFDVAALELPESRALTEARRSVEHDAPMAHLRPHVHPARLAMAFGDQAAELLGLKVRDEIRQHIASSCPACKAAARAVAA